MALSDYIPGDGQRLAEQTAKESVGCVKRQHSMCTLAECSCWCHYLSSRRITLPTPDCEEIE